MLQRKHSKAEFNGVVTSRLCPDCNVNEPGYRRRYCIGCREIRAKARKAADDLKYRSAHREDYRRRANEWLVTNREANRRSCRARRQANIDAEKEKDRIRYSKERDRRIATAARCYEANKDRVLARQSSPAGREMSRARAARYREDPAYRAHAGISRQIRTSIATRKAGRPWETILGYSVAALCTHLERQFTAGMSWANYGEWHIDHIRPRASFDLSTDAAVRDCWSLPNLRPLWATDNLRKSAKRTHLI